MTLIDRIKAVLAHIKGEQAAQNTAIAGKANLAGGNTLGGLQTVEDLLIKKGSGGSADRIYFGSSIASTPTYLTAFQGLGQFQMYSDTTLLAQFGLTTAFIRGAITFNNPLTIQGSGTESILRAYTGSHYWEVGNIGNNFAVRNVTTGSTIPLVIDRTTNNVGIGATTPNAKLDINSTSSFATHKAFRVRDSTNTRDFLVVNGAGDVYNNGATNIISNTFFGEDVGRVTAGSFNTFIGNAVGRLNTSGSSNTGVGRNALLANTTGATNTAIGSGAMSSNTTGGINVAIGASAMSGNTTGSNNIAIGLDALKSNTTSSGSIAVGRDALRNSTGGNNVGLGQNSMLALLTGVSNFAMGVNAGRFIGSSGTTPLTISNNSIFLGFNTRALVDNSDNEIVIGASAIGKGSNTVQIGNTSITHTHLQGQVIVGLATTDPVGVEGAIYFNTTTKKHRGFNGTVWNDLY